MKRDRFGFLPYKRTIEFEGGKISPLPEFEEISSWIDKYTHEDGFLYPPIVSSWMVDPITMKPLRKIPKTERPAHLHRIPPSHEICLSDLDIHEDIRKGPGSFIVHLLAYLFGVRLQFYEWWVDGRLPIREKAMTHSVSFSKDTVEHFLSHCYRTWRGRSEKEQTLLTNILFMHSRVPSYEWDWERFMVEYMVFDGCWKLGRLLNVFPMEKKNRKKICPHGERIKMLCQKLDIPINEDLIKKIVDLRNGLFHETLWDGSQPGTGGSNLAFMSPIYLRRLNHRLIPALIGYKTPYIQSKWWIHGKFEFDQPKLE